MKDGRCWHVMQKSVKDYIKYYAALYKSLFALSDAQQARAYYRIIKMPDDKDPRIHFQVVGKGVVLKMLPQKIMRDDLLLGFNRAEIAIITHLGTKNEVSANQKKYSLNIFKIIKQIFSNGKTKFQVESPAGEVIEKSPSELFNDKEVVENMNGVDGMKIGYATAEEHFQKIDEIKNVKKTS